jgi:hypothetical protein
MIETISLEDFMRPGTWELIDGETLSKLKRQLADSSHELGEYSVTLEMNPQVFGSGREQSLPLLQTGLVSSDGTKPYQMWGDSTPQRNVVDGEMMVVPQDRCPQCWGSWDVKRRYMSCPECSVAMGQNVRLLPDFDCCPICGEGSVTSSQTVYANFFTVSPDHVIGG